MPLNDLIGLQVKARLKHNKLIRRQFVSKEGRSRKLPGFIQRVDQTKGHSSMPKIFTDTMAALG
jgi:hypothetical protein